MNIGSPNTIRLAAAMLTALWLGACNAPLTEEAAPEDTSTAAPAEALTDATTAPDTITLDTTTQCELGQQVTDSFPDLPFELPTPPAEVQWTEANFEKLGTGYIGPVETAANPDTPNYLLVGFANADWVKRVVLPLYDEPNGNIDSWMACGWLMLGAQAEKSEMALPLFYPGYSGFGMLVLAEDGDWLQLHDGIWVLRSHLQSSTVPLAYQSWQDRYQAFMIEHANYAADDPTADWGYLFPKDPNTTLTLYSTPDAQAEPLKNLAATSSLLPLEIQGDWMRVRSYTPNNFCIDNWQGETREGWVRWMDADKGGNQLGEPYKGC